MKICVGETVITPPLEIPLAGYYYSRMPAGVHDDLHAKCLVLGNTTRIALVACDLIKTPRELVAAARRRIHKQTGLPPHHILISANHSHTGPVIEDELIGWLSERIAASVAAALRQETDARLFAGSQAEPRLAHNRRYRMRDGRVVTNPGFLNPEIVAPAGPIDPRVGVLHAKRSDGRSLMTWVNYAMHQDTVGGELISADFSYFLAERLAQVQGQETTTIFTIGAAADVNHWDLSRPGPQRGLETAEAIGATLAEDVLLACERLERVVDAPVKTANQTLRLPLQRVTPAEAAQARVIMASPPAAGMEFTLERVRARKIITIAERNGRDYEAEIHALTVGQVAFLGVPGELFAELGLHIQERSPYAHTFILELANDNLGYIPSFRAFREGGYEPASAILAPGTGEMLAEKAIEVLHYLAKN